MFDSKLTSISDIPLADRNRLKTDVLCAILGPIFAITMFVLAFVFLDLNHYYQSNLPTDSDHVSCGYGTNLQYPLVYFPDVSNVNLRVCVNQCPKDGNLTLICQPNSKVESCSNVAIYGTVQNISRLGGFCLPQDSGAATRIAINAGLEQKWKFLKTIDIILLSMAISLGVGIVWVILVQCLPKVMTIGVMVLSIFVLLMWGFLLIFDKQSPLAGNNVQQYVIGSLLIFLGMVFALQLLIHIRRINLIRIYVAWSTEYLRERWNAIIFIPHFIVFSMGFLVLCYFQQFAYLTKDVPAQQPNSIYLQNNINIALFILNIVEFIWGLQFLKDSYNFILSGLAAQWYLKADPGICLTFHRLLCYHFGSVVSGSFFNGFFNLLNFFFESLRCYPDGSCPACYSCYEAIFGCCADFFDLVRTDVYAYINLTGIPYCNAARNCDTLDTSAKIFTGCHSVLFFYRICAYTFTVGTALLLCYFLQRYTLDSISTLSLLVIALLSYCILAYFVDLHADSAEGIQVTYLIDSEINPNFQKQSLRYDPYHFKNEIERLHLIGK